MKNVRKKSTHCTTWTEATRPRNHASLKWEVALHIWSDQIVWANGPFKASCHDLTFFRSGLKAKMLADAPEKYVICDLGYRSQSVDEEHLLAIPNSNDPLPLKKIQKPGSVLPGNC